MPKDIPLKERIILALDVETPDQARELVKKTESRLGFYKVGLQLFMADWFNIVDWLADRGHKVMLDLKFFDIPETVKRAVARVRGHGVHFLTIHGNDPIIRAANEEKGEVKLLAVTVLTSFGEEDLRSMGMSGTIEELVFFRARRALELGCDGVVSSGLEAERLRTGLGDRLILVTPGIRPGANVLSAADDQQRVMTAGNAVRNGADHLVVGRPIARAEDPLAVIESMQEDIAASLTGV